MVYGLSQHLQLFKFMDGMGLWLDGSWFVEGWDQDDYDYDDYSDHDGMPQHLQLLGIDAAFWDLGINVCSIFQWMPETSCQVGPLRQMHP